MKKQYTNDNTSYTAYRVFQTLKFLINNPANVSEIIEHLEQLDENKEKVYSKALIYKYIATLKFAGIEIESQKCKFHIKNLPFKINFSDGDIRALKILEEILEYSPEKCIEKELSNLLYQIKIRSKDNSLTTKKQLTNLKKVSEKEKQYIELLEKYCKDKIKLNITRINIHNQTEIITCEPIDVKYEQDEIILYGYSPSLREYVELTQQQIINIEQTPSKCINRFGANTTIFKLKGKLAKRYTLRNEEKIMNLFEDGSITIANKKEAKDKLFLRLLRYGDLCEVISSKQDRLSMKNLIEKTLNNYKNT